MLFIAACLIAILITFYYQTEKGFYNEFARQNEVLSKAVQVAMGRLPAAPRRISPPSTTTCGSSTSAESTRFR